MLSVGSLPSTWCAAQGQQARTRGSPFAIVNGATAQDVLCVYVPDGVHLDKPIHILYIPSGDPVLPAGLIMHIAALEAISCARKASRLTQFS